MLVGIQYTMEKNERGIIYEPVALSSINLPVDTCIRD